MSCLMLSIVKWTLLQLRNDSIRIVHGKKRIKIPMMMTIDFNPTEKMSEIVNDLRLTGSYNKSVCNLCEVHVNT